MTRLEVGRLLRWYACLETRSITPPSESALTSTVVDPLSDKGTGEKASAKAISCGLRKRKASYRLSIARNIAKGSRTRRLTHTAPVYTYTRTSLPRQVLAQPLIATISWDRNYPSILRAKRWQGSWSRMKQLRRYLRAGSHGLVRIRQSPLSSQAIVAMLEATIQRGESARPSQPAFESA